MRESKSYRVAATVSLLIFKGTDLCESDEECQDAFKDYHREIKCSKKGKCVVRGKFGPSSIFFTAKSLLHL